MVVNRSASAYGGDVTIEKLIGVFAQNFFAITEANFAFRFGHARHCMRRIVKARATFAKIRIRVRNSFVRILLLHAKTLGYSAQPRKRSGLLPARLQCLPKAFGIEIDRRRPRWCEGLLRT